MSFEGMPAVAKKWAKALSMAACALQRLLLLVVGRGALCFELVGDEAVWDKIFMAQEAELCATGFQWPEGPTWTSKGLIFSDTISGKLYRWDEEAFEAKVLVEGAGGCPKEAEAEDDTYECDATQAEPGSNGISKEMFYIKNAKPSKRVALCQHGARRLAFMDVDSLEITPLTGYFRGLRHNGPNDVVLYDNKGSLFFTDPYYALLEKDRFYDHAYTDAKSEIGYAGVYRYNHRDNTTYLLHNGTERPNGLAFLKDRKQLAVSDCCQGASPTCPAGAARWNIFDVARAGFSLKHAKLIEHEDHVTAGCADGFKYHSWFDVLVASCPGGVCVVGLDGEGGVLAKLHFGHSVANVELGGGYAWFTGGGSLYRIRLQEKPQEAEL